MSILIKSTMRVVVLRRMHLLLLSLTELLSGTTLQAEIGVFTFLSRDLAKACLARSRALGHLHTMWEMPAYMCIHESNE